MGLQKQLNSVVVDFYSASADGTVVDASLKLQNFEVEAVHENPLGNPMYSQSLDGTLIPYSVSARNRYRLTFEAVKGSDIAVWRNLFNYFITYGTNPDISIRFYYNFLGVAGTSYNYDTVVLETPMTYLTRYTNQIGRFAPTLNLISKNVATSLSSSFEGV